MVRTLDWCNCSFSWISHFFQKTTANLRCLCVQTYENVLLGLNRRSGQPKAACRHVTGRKWKSVISNGFRAMDGVR